MTQLTKQDVREVVTEVVKDVGVVTGGNFGSLLEKQGVVTESNFGRLLKKHGVVTENNFGRLLEQHGVATKKDLSELELKIDKRLERHLNKQKKELITAISNLAVNSPTMGMFSKLEKRVDKLEVAVN